MLNNAKNARTTTKDPSRHRRSRSLTVPQQILPTSLSPKAVILSVQKHLYKSWRARQQRQGKRAHGFLFPDSALAIHLAIVTPTISFWNVSNRFLSQHNSSRARRVRNTAPLTQPSSTRRETLLTHTPSHVFGAVTFFRVVRLPLADQKQTKPSGGGGGGGGAAKRKSQRKVSNKERFPAFFAFCDISSWKRKKSLSEKGQWSG